MPPRRNIQQRNVRDVVIEDLQRELQQLQQRLAQLEPQENDREVDEAENVNEEPGDDEMGDNLFYRDYSEEESPRRANNRRFHRGADVRRVPNRPQRLDMGYVRDLGIKVDIPEFDGRLDPDEFCEWLLSVERALDFKELPSERIVKVVAVKLTKHAALWWENLKRTRNREGKKKINSWPKMKKYLQRKYLPDHYRQDLFLKLHHLKQENRSMNVVRQQAAPRNAQYITRKCSKCQGFGHIASNCPNSRVITVVEEMDEMNEKSKVSSVLLESNPKGSSGCNSLLQRALVRTYGAGTHVTSQLDDHHFMHTKGGHWQSDHIQSSYSSTREEYNKPFVKVSHVEAVVERQPDDSFLSRKHLNERKIINEFNMKDSPYDITIYGRTDGYAIRSSQSHFLKQEPYNSHSLEGSLNSGLGGSYQLPQMDFRLSRAGKSPTSCSTKKTEYLEGHSWLELDRRYQRSGSISNTINSSSYHPCPELRNMVHQNIPSDLACRQTTKIQYDDWEPSQPFRPSWVIATKRTSSPSQYDPILDSIKPPTANARDCFQSSQMSPFQNVSLLPSKTENALSQLVLFKLRVLSLLEIYTQKCPDKVHVLAIYSGVVQDYPKYQDVSGNEQLGQRINGILQKFQKKKLLVGADDVDIFKGISLKLLALEFLLKRNPDLRGKVVLVQIANPAWSIGKDVNGLQPAVEKDLDSAAWFDVPFEAENAVCEKGGTMRPPPWPSWRS